MEIIEDIRRRLPDTHIVMHGSTSVPADLVVERVRAAGGEVDDMRARYAAGVRAPA
jgi:fructose-bisphosphate aldolase class II